MAPKSERLITEALGHPLETENIDFSSTSVSGVMDSNSTYRVIASEDCYVNFSTWGEAADAEDMLMMAGLPETFVTLSNGTVINVIRKDTDGEISVTRMVSRKE